MAKKKKDAGRKSTAAAAAERMVMGGMPQEEQDDELMQSPFRMVVASFIRDKIAMIGMCAFIIIFLCCMILPFFFPTAPPGLPVGCFIANLFSPYSLDVVFGTLATLLACLATQRMPNKWLAPLPPVVCNAVIVGAECAWYQTGFGPAFWPAYAFNAFTVGLGELLACCVLGALLIRALPRIPVFRALIPADRLARAAA